MEELKRKLYRAIGESVVILFQIAVEIGKVYVAYHFIVKYW